MAEAVSFAKLAEHMRIPLQPPSESEYLAAMGMLQSGQNRIVDASGMATGPAKRGPAPLEYTVDMRGFNEHTMMGKYHIFRIKSKFPVPGGAVADDYLRRGLVERHAEIARKLQAEAAEKAAATAMKTAVHMKKVDMQLPSSLNRLMLKIDATIREKDELDIDAGEEIGATEGAPDDVKQIFTLINEQRVQELEALFEQGEINVNMAEPNMLMTGLIRSSSKGLLSIVKLYLEYGANPNCATLTGSTALHTAWDSWLAKNKHLPSRTWSARVTHDIVLCLLAYGASPNAKTRTGTTPMHMAAMYGHDQLLAAMLERGGNPKTADSLGRTPLDLARRQVEKGKIDRRGAIGLILNWDKLKSEKERADFKRSWQVAMQAAHKQTQSLVRALSGADNAAGLPPAGQIDVLGQGGLEASLAAAEAAGKPSMWASSVDVKRMLAEMNMEHKMVEGHHVQELNIVEQDERVGALPSAQALRERTLGGMARRGGRRVTGQEEDPGEALRKQHSASTQGARRAGTAEPSSEGQPADKVYIAPSLQEHPMLQRWRERNCSHPAALRTGMSQLGMHASSLLDKQEASDEVKRKRLMRAQWEGSQTAPETQRSFLIKSDLSAMTEQLVKNDHVPRMERARVDPDVMLDRAAAVAELQAKSTMGLVSKGTMLGQAVVEMREKQRNKYANAQRAAKQAALKLENPDVVKYQHSVANAQEAVQQLKRGFQKSAQQVMRDAKGVYGPTNRSESGKGEVYIRKPATDSSLLRATRWRVDTRAKAGTDGVPIEGALDEHQRHQAEHFKVRGDGESDMDGVTEASHAGAGAASRKHTLANAVHRTLPAHSKAHLRQLQAKQLDALHDARLLPASGGMAVQRARDEEARHDRSLTQVLSGAKSPLPSEDELKKQRRPQRLGQLNSWAYGDPELLGSAAKLSLAEGGPGEGRKQPRAVGALHKPGPLRSSETGSIVAMSTMDKMKPLPERRLPGHPRSFGARKPEYGVVKLEEGTGATRAPKHLREDPYDKAERIRIDAGRATDSTIFPPPMDPWRFETLTTSSPVPKYEHAAYKLPTVHFGASAKPKG